MVAASMDAASEARTGGRGADLLLHHCSTITRDDERPTPRERLESLLGFELAKMLVGALANRVARRGDV